MTETGELLAISDLHVDAAENKNIVASLRPHSDEDWLIVAGDVGEFFNDIEWALRLLSERFAQVLWVPGNHELWTLKYDPVRSRGEKRYLDLVGLCGDLGVLTPEDPYPVWRGRGGPLTVAPLFLLYDYTFRPAETATKKQALDRAYKSGVVCRDEYLLHPHPYPSCEAWCHERLRYTEQRLANCDPNLRTVLINHYPLVRKPTDVLWYPEFVQWCGTEHTVDWHLRYRAALVIYGHLHIPRTTWHDGVRFQEVSLGYPREWRAHGLSGDPLHAVLPEAS